MLNIWNAFAKFYIFMPQSIYHDDNNVLQTVSSSHFGSSCLKSDTPKAEMKEQQHV